MIQKICELSNLLSYLFQNLNHRSNFVLRFSTNSSPIRTLMLADIISIEKVELKNNQTFVVKSEHFMLNFPINQKISHFSVLYVHYYQNSVQIVLAVCSCRNWGGGGEIKI